MSLGGTLCTCGARAPNLNLDHHTSTPTRDIDCPIHGLDALIAQATPNLDIDEPRGGDDST